MGSVEMSLFHLLNAMRFSNSFVIFLIFSLVAEGSSTQPDVKNQGKDCWWVCGEKSGPCESFCGTDGLCCRRGNKWIEKGCNGHIGEDSHHTCVAKPNSQVKTDDEGLEVLGTVLNDIDTKLDKLGKLVQEEMCYTQCLKVW